MDDEVKGSKGTSYTTHFRQLDPRVGRWLSIDPKAGSMPWQSPYCSMDNNPVFYNDPMGDSVKINFENKSSEQALVAFMSTSKGREYIGKFAAKGQKIGGHTFNSSGEYNTDNFDLVLTDEFTSMVQGDVGNQGITDDGNSNMGGMSFGPAGLQDNGRFRINVNLNSNQDETAGGFDLKVSNYSKKYETNPEEHKQTWNKYIAFKAQTLGHELFVHAEGSIKDFTDNKLMDDSYFGGVDDHLYFGQHVGVSTTWSVNTNGTYKLKYLKTDKTTLFLYHGYKMAKEIHKLYNTGATDAEIYKKHVNGLDGIKYGK